MNPANVYFQKVRAALTALSALSVPFNHPNKANKANKARVQILFLQEAPTWAP